MGLDPNIAKRAGLLHDIGKGVPGELEGSHALIGADFIKRHGETPIVVNAVAAHHEEVKPETVYAGLVILADTISATRPGARAESMTSYIQRLGRLEKLALSIDGRAAGLRHPGRPRDPGRGVAPAGDRRPGPGAREGTAPADRDASCSTRARSRSR